MPAPFDRRGRGPLGAAVAGVVVAAMACAAMFLIAGRVEGSAVRTLFWIQVVVAPISLVFMLINGGPAPLAAFAAAPFAIAIAMAAYAIAFVFQLMASKRISASRTAGRTSICAI